jgi:hypothetical protein
MLEYCVSHKAFVIRRQHTGKPKQICPHFDSNLTRRRKGGKCMRNIEREKTVKTAHKGKKMGKRRNRRT